MLSKKIIAPLMLTVAISATLTHCVTAQTLYGSAGAQDTRENATNMDWAYNWSNTPKYDVAKGNFEFVPMIWTGGAAGVINQVNTIKALERTHGVHVDYVLGFNEPELSTQANMTVEQAINSWEVITGGFSNTDIKLVSPAVSGNREITRPDVPGLTRGRMARPIHGRG